LVLAEAGRKLWDGKTEMFGDAEKVWKGGGIM
jgi:hypothetical protein